MDRRTEAHSIYRASIASRGKNVGFLAVTYKCKCALSVYFIQVYINHGSVYFDSTKGKGSLYSITERRVPELIPILVSQPAGDVSHKPSGRLPLLSARPAVTPATLKRAATNFAAW